MKEVLGSLPEVITAYKNYNLLVPTATDVQLNPFYKFHVEEVPVDLGENSGDIFKVGSVKTGKQDERGRDIWEDVFSLSKPLLNKMAMAAGIQFNPKETYGERIDRVTYRAQAQGAMRKADGTARTAWKMKKRSTALNSRTKLQKALLMKNRHRQLRKSFLDNGWNPRINGGRNARPLWLRKKIETDTLNAPSW